MKISAGAVVAAPRERVFAALNDRDVLRRCIPGCEELTDAGEAAYHVQVKLGLAGIKGRYAGQAVHQDLQPPESFVLAFDGKGKTGFVRGTAAVRISDAEGVTSVDADADVHVGGAIAAVGSRLIAAAARKLTRDFFRQVAIELGVPAEDAEPQSEEQPGAKEAPELEET